MTRQYDKALEFRASLAYQEKKEFDEVVKAFSTSPVFRNFGVASATELVYSLMIMLGQDLTHPLDLHGARTDILREGYKNKMLDENWSHSYAEETAKRATQVIAEKGDI